MLNIDVNVGLKYVRIDDKGNVTLYMPVGRATLQFDEHNKITSLADNTCRALDSLNGFFDNLGNCVSAKAELQRIQQTLQALKSHPQQAVIDKVLNQVNAYLKMLTSTIVQTWQRTLITGRQEVGDGFKSAYPAPLLTLMKGEGSDSNNFYAGHFKPAVNDDHIHSAYPVFSIKRDDTSILIKTFNEQFTETILRSLRQKTCREQHCERIQEQIPAGIQYDQSQLIDQAKNLIESYFLKNYKKNVDLAHDRDGKPLVYEYLANDGDELQDVIENLLNQCFNDDLFSACPLIEKTESLSYFNSSLHENSVSNRREKISILLQIFLFNLNIFLIEKNYINRDVNLGKILDENEALSQGLCYKLYTALKNGHMVEDQLLRFFNQHQKDFSLNKKISAEDFQAIIQQFNLLYAANQDAPYFDDMMCITNKPGCFYYRQNSIVCHFSTLLTQLSPAQIAQLTEEEEIAYYQIMSLPSPQVAGQIIDSSSMNPLLIYIDENYITQLSLNKLIHFLKLGDEQAQLEFISIISEEKWRLFSRESIRDLYKLLNAMYASNKIRIVEKLGGITWILNEVKCLKKLLGLYDFTLFLSCCRNAAERKMTIHAVFEEFETGNNKTYFGEFEGLPAMLTDCVDAETRCAFLGAILKNYQNNMDRLYAHFIAQNATWLGEVYSACKDDETLLLFSNFFNSEMINDLIDSPEKLVKALKACKIDAVKKVLLTQLNLKNLVSTIDHLNSVLSCCGAETKKSLLNELGSLHLQEIIKDVNGLGLHVSKKHMLDVLSVLGQEGLVAVIQNANNLSNLIQWLNEESYQQQLIKVLGAEGVNALVKSRRDLSSVLFRIKNNRTSQRLFLRTLGIVSLKALLATPEALVKGLHECYDKDTYGLLLEMLGQDGVESVIHNVEALLSIFKSYFVYHSVVTLIFDKLGGASAIVALARKENRLKEVYAACPRELKNQLPAYVETPVADSIPVVEPAINPVASLRAELSKCVDRHAVYALLEKLGLKKICAIISSSDHLKSFISQDIYDHGLALNQALIHFMGVEHLKKISTTFFSSLDVLSMVSRYCFHDTTLFQQLLSQCRDGRLLEHVNSSFFILYMRSNGCLPYKEMLCKVLGKEKISTLIQNINQLIPVLDSYQHAFPPIPFYSFFALLDANHLSNLLQQADKNQFVNILKTCQYKLASQPHFEQDQKLLLQSLGNEKLRTFINNATDFKSILLSCQSSVNRCDVISRLGHEKIQALFGNPEAFRKFYRLDFNEFAFYDNRKQPLYNTAVKNRLWQHLDLHQVFPNRFSLYFHTVLYYNKLEAGKIRAIWWTQHPNNKKPEAAADTQTVPSVPSTPVQSPTTSLWDNLMSSCGFAGLFQKPAVTVTPPKGDPRRPCRHP